MLSNDERKILVKEAPLYVADGLQKLSDVNLAREHTFGCMLRLRKLEAEKKKLEAERDGLIAELAKHFVSVTVDIPTKDGIELAKFSMHSHDDKTLYHIKEYCKAMNTTHIVTEHAAQFFSDTFLSKAQKGAYEIANFLKAADNGAAFVHHHYDAKDDTYGNWIIGDWRYVRIGANKRIKFGDAEETEEEKKEMDE